MNYICLLEKTNMYLSFTKRLKERGENVLIVGTMSYDYMNDNYSDCFHEYWQIDNLNDYETLYKIVAYIIYKYGRIDYIQGENYHIVECLMTDFNLSNILNKKQIAYLNKNEVVNFDYSYHGLIDNNKNLILSACFKEAKKRKKEDLVTGYYMVFPDSRLVKLINKLVDELDLKRTYFNFKIKKIKADYEIVGLDLSIPNKYYLDCINYSYDIDLLDILIKILAKEDIVSFDKPKYLSGYVGRYDQVAYLNSQRDVVFKYNKALLVYQPTNLNDLDYKPDMNYLARFSNEKEVKEFIKYLLRGR